MKYVDFLIEKKKYDNTDEIDIEEFKKIYANLDNKKPFYRGMKSAPSDIMVIDGSKRERKSLDIGNHYTVLFDEMNKDLPNRKNAVFFSGSNNVSFFGTVYYVFPFNNTKIVCVNKKDMWGVPVYTPLKSKRKSFIDMQDIINIFDTLNIPDDSLSSIVSGIKKIVKNFVDKYPQKVDHEMIEFIDATHINKLLHDDKYDEVLAIMFEYNEATVESQLKQMFNYEKLKFSVYNSTKDLPDSYLPYEYWIDGKALVIDRSLFDSIKKDLE